MIFFIWLFFTFGFDFGAQILSAYFVVLPLRDEGAISLGLSKLPGLFLGSLVLTLIAAPVSTLIFSSQNISKAKVCMYPSFILMPTVHIHFDGEKLKK